MNSSGIRHPRSTARARTGALAASAALVSLAALTGCGGSDSGDSAATDVSPSASAADTSAAASAVKPLTSAELETAALAKADLTGYEVSTPGKAETAASDGVKVSGHECVPLGRALAGAAVGESAAATHRRVTGGASAEAPTNINTVTVTLASYASADEATAALKSVSDAVTACAGGFRWTSGGEQYDPSKVTKGTAPEAGEEAVAFTAVTPMAGVDAPMKVVVFRDGATLAHFTVFNVAAVVSGEDFAFPTDLVTAQADKLA